MVDREEFNIHKLEGKLTEDFISAFYDIVPFLGEPYNPESLTSRRIYESFLSTFLESNYKDYTVLSISADDFDTGDTKNPIKITFIKNNHTDDNSKYALMAPYHRCVISSEQIDSKYSFEYSNLRVAIITFDEEAEPQTDN